ncbi:4-hydroxy-tetrahydrodipicolinate reductase [Ornithinimicrobium avium]|uniref:4-hydroxy-tetrahydrodipicolinate reductase n=1 Tax=Ornithinimicrobium avium TaxID=2283195 RepID=A0A345NN22_9MICO|nr:dihydrodipicolinate reductase C-terminal domain-containing protein [Ornithinimicrobium avium]AXH96430.1 4-hydroxy-tetrahydrodipicolinate reductase [Ornithinimicrobium avium]
MTTLIGLLGTGRLGSAIRHAAAAQDDLEVRWSVGRGPVPDARVDVAIDVSAAAAVPGHLAWAQRTGTPVVVGTTGWDLTLLDDLAPEAQVLVAPNFSVGVALVRRLALVLGGYAARSPVPVDLAVTDTHHRHKVDAPSGTALTLREALAEGAGRPVGSVQTTSLRVGSVVGDHEVVAASQLETITLRHSAHGRDLFAAGALTAARWLLRRPRPGVHTLDDLAEDHLHALLASSCEHGAPIGAPAPA